MQTDIHFCEKRECGMNHLFSFESQSLDSGR